MFASGDHARFSDHLTRRIYAPIRKKCRFARFIDPLTREKSLYFLSSLFCGREIFILRQGSLVRASGRLTFI